MQINPTKVVGMFAVSAVLIGAAVFVSWLLFGRGLNHDVRRMMQTMAALNTVTIKTEWADTHVDDVPFFPPPAEEFSVHFGSQGQMDLTQKPNLTFAQVFAVDTSVDGAEMSGEYRDFAGSRFLYLKEAPSYGDVDLTSFVKQWIVIPKTFSFNALSGNGWLNDLNEENFVELLSLVSKIDLVEATKTGIVEIINGDAALPYEFTINQEGMKVFLATLWEMRHGSQIDALSFQEITDQVKGWESAKGTLWIGRKSFLLHRLKVETIDQKLTVDFKAFDAPVEVKTPAPDLDVAAALGKLGFNVAALPTAEVFEGDRGSALGSLVDEAAAKNVDDPDEDGMDNAFEFFYGTDPNNPDTDGDGLTDGYEVEHSMNPRGTGSIFSFGLPQ